MSRRPRFTVENGTYHIMSRGHNKKNIFHEISDFRRYKSILINAKRKYSIEVYHYTLMTNHVHLILMVPEPLHLSKSMRLVNQSYAQYYRKKYGGVGYVWQDRYKSFLIQKGIYLLECGRYVELNSLRAGIAGKLGNYEWSSCRAYLDGKNTELVTLDPEYMAISANPIQRRKKYMQFLIDGINEKRTLTRYFKDGVYGDKKFVRKLTEMGLKRLNWRMGRPHK